MDDTKSISTAVWWVVWISLIAGLVTMHAVLAQTGGTPMEGAMKYVPVIPVVFSTLLRWFILPRFTVARRAFPMFIVGLSAAESTGILGLFLFPGMETTYLVLSLITIAQYIPVFASKLER